VLQVLNVAANPLCVLPHWVSRLQHLHTLLLSSTHLQELPSCISSLVRLRHLDLASNKLQVCVLSCKQA
jgi:Leucine-rich repeat (LRR) protein